MQSVRGVVIGSLKDCGSDLDLLELFRDFFEPFAIPVVRNLPFGHHGDNLMLPLGASVRLSTLDHTLTITQPVVA